MSESPDRPPITAAAPFSLDLPKPNLDGAHWFPTAALAREALHEYAYRVHELAAERDALIRGAIAADVPVSAISTITGIARSTINRIEPRPVAEPVDEETLRTYAGLLNQRAQRIATRAPQGSGVGDDAERYFLDGYVQVTREEAVSWLSDSSPHDNPHGDRVLHRAIQLEAQTSQSRASQLTRRFRSPVDRWTGWIAYGRDDARDRIARELRLIRGGMSPLSMFTQEEREAAEVPPEVS
ncbi:hypothetical protein Caci_2823 [Catenulispora acidiphila DSM 44928]|uniref:Uncharacterized protein n=1 Tax=Catenulispora acidiphila (strain DSM 44928 / JCM 14897 / NBRC 102108 / NRRL B-24433 / ID139908) TaxID=479433 RepID=C7Q157_CATAD|nr:hypothetical protein [Catenulispora acidiphila]ACU71732.1 hypothetical protein Caci_2823 [Catenulispora acidiphila DSM 44928]